MLGNPMLDVAIGLIFLYLVLSIIVTVLQEFISSYLKWRPKNLQDAIVELIGKENKAKFFKHPLIFPLFRGGVKENNGVDGDGWKWPKRLLNYLTGVDNGDPSEGGPVYIPKRNFALAVLDLLTSGRAVSSKGRRTRHRLLLPSRGS
jgi:hypothetical protein